jgi:DNA damage-inducible protein 1
MLKAHQAIIDLKKNCMIIQGREVQFLPEHELPDKGDDIPTDEEIAGGPSTAGPSQGGSISSPAARNQPQSQGFPSGGGRTLGSAPGARAPAARSPAPSAPPQQQRQHQAQQQGGSRWPEASIQTLMDFGATRELAISTLEAAGGNLDVAASLLF